MTTLTNGFDSGDKKKMKVLYDFEAIEDNELSFKTGDIIVILDDSDVNWWKGEGANGVGLFPSNFVTPFVEEEKHKNETQTYEGISNNNTTTTNVLGPSEPVVVKEVLIDCTLNSLQSTDPETTTTDSPELLRNEDACLAMGRLIDNQLEELDKQHLDLSHLNEKILESLKLYDKLMNQVPTYPHRTTNGPSNMPAHPSSNPHVMQHGVPTAYQLGPTSYTPAVNPNYHPSPPTAYPPVVAGSTIGQSTIPVPQINQFN